MNSTSGTAPVTSSTFVTGLDRVGGPRDLAGLQRDTVALMTRHPAIFIALPALAFLPFDFVNELVSSALGGDDARGVLAQMRAYHRISQLIELAVGSLVAATVLQAAVAVGEGRQPTMTDALKAGVAGWGRAVKTTFVSGIFIGFASLLLLVPGLVLATRYMLAIPASVIDGHDSTAARARSTSLVQERGTFRLFLWGLGAAVCWCVLAMLPTVLGSLLLPDLSPLPAAVLNAGLASIANVISSGFVVAVGLLYLELAQRPLAWPVGLELRTHDGQRLRGPRGTGQAGLVAVGLVGGLTAMFVVPFILLSMWFLIDPDGALAVVDESPMLRSIVEHLADSEPVAPDEPSSVPAAID